MGAALARALMADTAAALDATATTVRSAFAEGDLITQTKAPKRAATVAIIVAGPNDSNGSDRSTVIAALAASLNPTGKGVVVAGPPSSSADGGAVKAVREGGAAAEISTVDVIDSAAGRIVAVLATAAQVADQPGSSGHLPQRRRGTAQVVTARCRRWQHGENMGCGGSDTSSVLHPRPIIGRLESRGGLMQIPASRALDTSLDHGSHLAR
ncbi:copper transporter [Aeromicrobium sp. UC242_57]|uniref:copper transporter n=1 Tax=Aeromicrobium sp. UC242_57 TaxID=3374624 RepID=UPI0037A67D6B